ncbi:MAG: phosphoribosyltransferase [Clostridium perfringens]|nr:phosphoribosyltransferase [Clostridium perfringens]
MNKILIFSIDVYKYAPDKTKFEELLDSFYSQGDKIIFTSQFEVKKSELDNLNFKNYIYLTRAVITSKLKERKEYSKYFIVIGNTDQDLYLAANNKLLFITPIWCPLEEKADKYGFKSTKLSGLEKLLKIVENQNSWFYRLDLDDKTTVLALTNANTFGRNNSVEETEIIENFKKVLKEGDKRYYNVLLCHFLAAISNNLEFKEIQDWAIYPSSGTTINEDMLSFKERARWLMGGKKKHDMFIRHTSTWQSKKANVLGENRLPCDRHFDTIVLGPKYKNRLKDRVVCVFDDYTTNGTSFEVARNMLLKEGVKKIFFVALGKYHRNRPEQYIMQNYNLKGDLTKPGFTYELISSEWKNGDFDNNAKQEIEELYNILHN